MRKKKRKRIIQTALLFVFLFAFIMLSVFTSFSDITKNTVLTATSPIQRFLFDKASGLQRMAEVFRGAGEVEEEIRQLRRENKELSVRLALLKEIEKENKELRKALGLDFRGEPQKIFSEIIGKDISRHHLVIRPDGEVEEGNPVVTSEGVLVGVVSEVYGNFSKVRLITGEKSAFEVKVQNEEEPIGLLKGKDREGLLLDLLPKEKKVEEGDFVVTLPGNDIGIRGIYIGEIEEVIKNDVEAFLQAKVRPGFDIRYLDFIFVLKK